MLLLLVCSSYALAAERPDAAVAQGGAGFAPQEESVRRYRVANEDSYLRVFVMRGGALARFGHNHVIGGPVIGGEIWLADDPADTDFQLAVDVTALEVDRPAWRAEAGAAFASKPDAKDIAGTRMNMLGSMVLDADQYPVIAVDAAGVTGQMPEFKVLARINLKGQAHTLPITVKLGYEGQKLVAEGQFSFKQSDLGLQPFSVLLGTLSVRDELRVAYRIVGEPRP